MTASTRHRASRFAWLMENASTKGLRPSAEARAMPAASAPVPSPTQFTTPPPNKGAKVVARTGFRERFSHLLALTPPAPVGTPETSQEASVAATVARFEQVAKIARGQAPASQANKPPKEAAALIKKMTSLYDKFKGAN